MADKPYDEKHLAPDPRKTARESSAWRRDIDENLRRVYRTAPDEDLPERLRTLLAQLSERNGIG